jgi:hypothetical protein
MLLVAERRVHEQGPDESEQKNSGRTPLSAGSPTSNKSDEKGGKSERSEKNGWQRVRQVPMRRVDSVLRRDVHDEVELEEVPGDEGQLAVEPGIKGDTDCKCCNCRRSQIQNEFLDQISTRLPDQVEVIQNEW